MRKIFEKHSKKCLIAFLAVACALGVTACNKNKGDDSSTPPASSGPEETLVLALNNESASMLLGDELYLKATDNKITDISWESTNPAVAAVDANGVVSAMSVGEATVKATYLTQTAECKITVSKGDEMPVLRIEGLSGDEAVVSMDEKLNVLPKVVFNGKTFEDGTWTYELSDATVGKVEDGTFIPLKAGTTTLTVKGTWRGESVDTLIKTVDITVGNAYTVAINGGLTDSLLLYTAAQHGGKAYATSSPFVVSIKENNAEIAHSVAITDGSNVIAYDNATKTVTALTYGEAEITVSFKDSDNQDNSVVIPVTVERPVTTYGETIEYFSAMDGDLPVEQIFGGTTTLVHAYQRGVALTVEENKLFGVETLRTGMTATQFTVFSDTVGYLLNVEAYTKVIEDESDLRLFDTDQDGFFVMKNDVECTGEWYNNGKFNGVFDGQGHKINNLAIPNHGSTRGGIFGTLGEGSVIKNTAITNVKLNGYSAAVIAAGSSSSYYVPATIENLFVSVAKIGTRPAGLLWERGPWDTIRNVIVDVTAVDIASLPTDRYKKNPDGSYILDNNKPIQSGHNHGALFANDQWGMRENGNNWKRNDSGITNVYVLGSEGTPIARNVGFWNGNYGDFTATMWASNEGIEANPEERTFVYSGVKRFDDMFALSNAVIKVGTDNEYWLVTESGVEWLGELPEVETVEFAETIKFFSAMDGDLPMEQIFGADADNVVITEAYQGATKLNVVNNKVLGVATSSIGMTSTQIIICTAKVNYLLNLEAYTKVIDEESDFEVFDVTEGNVEGYYVLKDDVQCAGETLWMNYYPTGSGETKHFFNGIFDGLGHKVIGMKVGDNGIFGALGAKAIIRNVAFTDTVLSGRDYWKNTALFAHESIAGASGTSRIENVYINIADFRSGDAGNRAAGLIYVYQPNLVINNVIMEVETDNFTATPQYGYGVLFETDRVLKDQTPNMTNVYVVSALAPMCYEALDNFSTQDVYDPANNWIIYASNDKDTAGKIEKAQTIYYEGVKRYDDLAKLAAVTTQVGNWMVSADGVVWTDLT